MKTIAWLAGIGTMVTAFAYMVVSLNRWEWNRALFFGLIVLIAEVGLATGLVLRKIGQIIVVQEDRSDLEAIVRAARPPTPDRFAWLRKSTSELNVFITFLVGGGVLLSGLAWVVDRVAARTSTPTMERRLVTQMATISYPRGGLLVDEITALAQDVPGADDEQIGKLLRRVGERMKLLVRLALGAVGLAVGAVAVLALKEATLSTHRKVTDATHTVVVLEARVHGTEHAQTLDETVEAILVACRLEVSSDLEDDPKPLGDGVFEASLVPALDETNRRQLRGCLEDWTLDQLKVDVLSLTSAP